MRTNKRLRQDVGEPVPAFRVRDVTLGHWAARRRVPDALAPQKTKLWGTQISPI